MNVRNLKLSIVSMAFVVAAQLAAAQPAENFDFKGVPLEISYDEFRQLPHPDGTEGAIVVCTGEKVAMGRYPSEPLEVRVYGETENNLGVKKCVWVSGVADEQMLRSAGQVLPLKLAGSGYVAYDYSFSFLPDPTDGVLRLYQFQAETNHNAAQDVMLALTQKWGKPVTTKEQVQNRMGASFDRIVATWSKPGASIFVQDRWLKIDKMMMLMSSQRFVDIIAEAEEKRKASIPNPI